MADVVMPRLSDSMEEGTILRWLKADGDRVVRGEEIVEIETDKATMLYASDADGVLAIVAPEGETLPIGTLIATLDGGDSTGPASVPASPPLPEPAPAPAPSNTPARPGAQDERVRASPLARRMARELGMARRKAFRAPAPAGASSKRTWRRSRRRRGGHSAKLGPARVLPRVPPRQPRMSSGLRAWSRSKS